MTGSAGSRCAVWARDVQLNPSATTPQCDVFVLVEHPLPWPSDVKMDPVLAELERVAVANVGASRSVRLQAIAGASVGAARRVIVYKADGPPFTAYARSEAAGSPDELPQLVASLVESDPLAPEAGAVTDVLVCTHGSRDTCCGSLGTRLWLDLGSRTDAVRVWRTSHTGGHRFAPTAITFPDGNYWAHLDSDLLKGIVTRRVAADEASMHLRGCAAFTPPVQAADAAVLAQRGWSWINAARFGEQRSDRRVELCYQTPDGERGSYDVLLAEGRSMPVPDCGGDAAAASKFQVELRVARLQAWPDLRVMTGVTDATLGLLDEERS